MTRKLSQLLVLSVLILGVFSFTQMIPAARAQTPGVVCVAPDLPGQTTCPPAPGVALSGPVTSGPSTLIRVAVFIQATDPMNGFEVTLLFNHLVALPVGVDLTGSIVGAGPTVLLECLQNVAVIGGPCLSTDTLDTLHIAVVAAAGGIPGGTTPPGASGLLFTAIYQIQSATTITETIGFQTGCTITSVASSTTCINIANGTKIPVPETGQTGTFTSSSTQPSLQLSPASTGLGNAFPGTAIPAQTVTTTDVNGYGPWQFAGGVASGDATISYAVTVSGPTSSATGITATLAAPNPQDFSTSTGAGFAVTNGLTFTNAATTTTGTWTISVAGTYHFDPNCVSGVGCPGPASTLVEIVTYTVNIEDFGFSINGAVAGSTFNPFWCPAPSQGGACPAGSSGVASIVVSSKGYVGSVTLTNGAITPGTTPPLAAALSTATIAGASGTATDTITGGLLRPTAALGSYSMSVTSSGTLAANGVFPAQTKSHPITLIIRPQNFNITTSNGTPTGPSLSFASGASTTDTLTIGSLPSGTAAGVTASGFAGQVAISSTFTGGTGLTISPATTPVTLVAGQKLTDVVTFSGTVTTTTTFSVTITGTASLATSNPGTQTQSVTYSVTITVPVTAHPTSTTVTCATPVVVNQGSTCNVSVTDTSASGASTPTGTVSLSETGVTGSFTTCTLAGTTATAACTSTFTASTSGTAAVTASYPGVLNQFGASSGTTSVVVSLRATTTTVSCTTPVVVNQGSTCSVTVTDTSPGTFITPSGTVGLAETGVTGAFTTCTLAGTTASATCTSTFTASTSGTAAVTSSYPGDSAHSLSSGTASITVNPATHPTTTAVTCTTPVAINEASSCVVTVTDTSLTGASTPTGTVALTETGVTGSFTTCTLTGTTSSATCTSTFTASTSGTASVTASYPGVTGSFNPSSGTTSIVVNPRVTSTTVTCTTPVVLNQGSTCTVTVTDTSSGTAVTPTGTVALTQNGVTGSFTTCTLAGTTASATCTSTFTATALGTRTAAVIANYPGDNSHTSSSGTASIVVNPRATTTTVVCSPGQVFINQGSTCVVTVTDTSPGTFISPTGTVSLSQTGVTGSFTACILAGTTASATCTSTFTGSTFGSSSITANYPGDTTHTSSSGATSIVVIIRTTTTTVTCTPISVSPGQTSTCTATVNDPSTNPGTPITPTGTVTFTNTGAAGTFTGSPCNLVAGTLGTASCQVTFTASPGSGTANIVGTYSGDSTHGGSASTSFPITIGVATTTLTVTCTSPIIVNQGSTCNVSVTDTSTTGATTPTGTVTLGQTGVTGSFTTCNLTGTTATSTCTSTFTASSSGTASVTATYSGDTTHGGSQGTTSIVVNPRTTATTVSCTTPVNVNTGSTCNVTVTDTSTAGTFLTPTGNVGLSETGVTGSFTTCTLSGTTASATCTSTFTPTSGGTASLTASYPGDSAHSSSSGTTSVVVNVPARVTATIVSCTSPVVANQGSACTVTVTDSSATGATTPTGTVSLSETGITGSFTTCTLAGTTASATCTSTFTATTSGTASVTASYPGDTTHTASSGTTSVVVNPRTTSPSINCTSPVNTGQGSTCTITVTDTSVAGTFLTPTGTVSLSETGVTGSFTTCTLAGTTASATCTSTFTASTSGTAAVSASYPGDSAHSSTSGTTSITVNPIVGVPTVTVNGPTPNPANTGATVTVTFTVSSTVTVTSIAVDWGDGSTADLLGGNAVSDTHVYSSTGNLMSKTFTITVTATNSAGPGSGTTTQTVNDRAPIASFTFNPASPSAGQTVSFDASASTDPDGTIVSYAWSFGDGTTGTGVSPTHVYTPAANMTFTVTLTVTDNSGSTGSASHTITVIVAVVSPPVATITNVSPDPASTGQTVTLTFSVSSTAPVTGVTVNWGDGTTPDSLSGTATSDTHVYSTTGNLRSENFTITVTATNPGGSGQANTIETINDRAPTLAINSVTPNPAGIGQTVTASFTASDIDGTVQSIIVNWGDGSIVEQLPGTATSDTHSYGAAGNFTISLTATDNSGNNATSNTIETVTTVTATPILLTFQAFNFSAFHNGIGPFTVLVNGHVVVVFPGHGFVSTSSTVVFGTDKFVNLGPYDITAFVIPGQNNVTFVNTFGIRFSLIRNVMVTQGSTVFLNFAGPRFVSPARPLTLTFSNPPLVITSFTVTGNPVTDNKLTFTATYTGGTAPFKCIFLFGDDEAASTTGTATSCSVTHDFDDPGTFNVRVIVIGSSTSDRVSSSLSVTVTGPSSTDQLTIAIATGTQVTSSDDD